jgi:tRNA pseudouridine55 synthase
LLLVDKPAGITSHDAVAKVRRALGTTKVGHAGTLDPMATGLLRLGVRTTTLDAEGDVTDETDASGVTAGMVAEAMAAKRGTSAQRPPAYSAVKVGGRKLYDAARKGETLEAAARVIRVDRFELVAYRAPDVDFATEVSGGTYVRVLAAEVGDALGVGAHLTRLRRISIGPFSVQDAVSPEDPGAPLPVERAVAHLPRVEVEPEEARAAANGSVLGPAGVEGPYAVFGPQGRLIGIWRDDGPKAKPEMVLAEI